MTVSKAAFRPHSWRLRLRRGRLPGPAAASPARALDAEPRRAHARSRRSQPRPPAPDRAAQDSALAAARAAARSADARYARRPLPARDRPRAAAMRADAAQAVDTLVAAASPSPTSSPPCSRTRRRAPIRAGDIQRAEAAAGPGRRDPAQQSGRARRSRPVQGAHRAMPRRPPAPLIAARHRRAAQAAGRPAPESWYAAALRLAVRQPHGAAGDPLARGLVAAYPSAGQLARRAARPIPTSRRADPALDLDVRRLLRASQALAGERDYLEYAQAADRAGLPRRGQGGARRRRRARHDRAGQAGRRAS